MTLALGAVYLISLILLTALVAVEVAFAHMRDDRLERLVQRRRPGARRLAALQETHEPLAMAFLIVRATATAVFAVVSFALVSTAAPSDLIGIPVAFVAAIGGVILAQAAGRVWGRHDAERLALRLAPLVAFVSATLSLPAQGLLTLFRPLARILGRPPRADSGAEGGEAMDGSGNGSVNGDAPSGVDEEWERSVIRGVLRLESMSVREIMVPRPDIVAIEAGATLEDAVGIVLREGYSRLPLYRGNLDDTLGIVYAKDLLATLQRGDEPPLETVGRPAFLIPETKKVGDLLREFQEKRVHIALVVDEYGSLVGLVTNEDLLEEIVGEIEDEFTVSEPLVERLGTNEAIVDARAPLNYINDLFGVELHVDGVDTLGGLIFDRLGHIPNPGELVAEDGMTMTVLSTTGRRVRQVRIIHGVPTQPEPSRQTEEASAS